MKHFLGIHSSNFLRIRALLCVFFCFVFLFLTSCTGKNPLGFEQTGSSVRGGEGSTGGGSVVPVSTASVSITYPSAGKYAGWSVRVKGTCSDNGTNVDIKDSGNLISTTATCAGNLFDKFVDISSLAVGSQTLQASQLDSSGVRSSYATISIQKTNSNCDVAANRAKLYATGLAGGAGTLTNPYILCTPLQLYETRNGSSVSYLMQNDIDFENTDTNGDNVTNGSDADYVSGSGWDPGALSSSLTTRTYFDGGSFEIRNLFINRNATSAGLFTSVYGVIRNLSILSANITLGTGGILANDCIRSFLFNVHTSGSLTTATGGAGGLCALGNIVVRSSSTATITSVDGAGGLIFDDSVAAGIVANSYFSGSVTGDVLVGGLVGYLGKVFNSYSTGTVAGRRIVGGIVGGYGSVVNSFSSMNVSQSGAANPCFGGIAGYSVSIKNSFATGNITLTTSTDLDRLLGCVAAGSVTNSYYWSGSTCTGGAACTTLGTAEPTLSDFYSAANAPLSSWDFSTTTLDGADDHWTAVAGALPQMWFESSSTVAAPFTGAGTSASPYIISSAAEFDKIGSNSRWMDAYFQLTNNIDLSTLVTQHAVAVNSGFAGEFAGGNFTISNFSYNDSTSYAGLFGAISWAKISQLRLSNPTVVGGSQTGSVIGNASVGNDIDRVSSTGGSVTGESSTGGLIGKAYYSTVVRSSSTSNVTAIAGSSDTGGLVGYSQQSTISNSYARGTVTGITQVGGLVGFHEWNAVVSSYAIGNVTGTTHVGGLIGNKTGNAGHTVTNSFAIGTVNGNSAAANIGLFIGTISDPTGSTGNYVSATGSCTNAGAGGCNASLFATQPGNASFYNSANAPLTTWDFATIWIQNGADYPTLQ